MGIGLLSIGTELVRGEVANTNATWLADQLTQLGFDVDSVETVADEPARIEDALGRLSERYSHVIVTGGLGPTSDDLTAQSAANLIGAELEVNEDALVTIQRKIEGRGRELKPGHTKQAQLPRGSEILQNTAGTAPGFILRQERSTSFFLPGVPHEMQNMFREQVEPRIRGAASHNSFQIVLHTYGRGESWISERLEGVEQRYEGVTLGFLVKHPDVDVKILCRAGSYAEAREGAEAAATEIREALSDLVYGEDQDTMVSVATRGIRTRGWRLAVAESCTGGLIAQKLTTHPASDYFVGAAITYANAAKTQLLGVSEDTLRGHGAVSPEVAAEMAEGARRAFDCDIAISVTGIAGPTGATSDKPLGLCHWAVAHPGGTKVEEGVFSGNRNQVQRQAAHAALDLLRRTVLSSC